MSDQRPNFAAALASVRRLHPHLINDAALLDELSFTDAVWRLYDSILCHLDAPACQVYLSFVVVALSRTTRGDVTDGD